MPTYEYECRDCGGHFEFFHSMSESKETCESCGGGLTKLLSAGSGLIFKGSGFYITDYKNSGGGKGSRSSGGGENKGGDSKPAASETKAEKSSS